MNTAGNPQLSGMQLENYPEYPDPRVIEEVRQFFAQLIDIESELWGVELSGYRFTFALLQEWESREIARRLSGLDPLAKAQLMKLEVLVRAIVSVTTPNNQEMSFLSHEEKVKLRHVLLSLKPDLIDYLYQAYLWGAEQLREKFEEIYGKIEEVGNKGFFVSSGG